MLRSTLGVICGYAIFVISSLLLFKLSGVKPHGDVSTSFMLLTIIYGFVFSLLAGFVCQMVAGPPRQIANYMLATVIAGFAAFSYFKAEGSHWSQLLAIFIFAPTSIFGGYLYQKKYHK